MASAYQDARGYWCGCWRGYQQRGGQTKRRPAPGDLRPGHEAGDAAAWATECERYARRLEQPRPARPDIEHAARIRAITAAQAALLLGGELPGDSAHGPATIDACHAGHPSTQAELRRRPDEARRHARELAEFLRWSGLRWQRDVRLPLVLAWLDRLRASGRSWDGRRHCLLPIRRACRMGAALHGLADPLSGFKLDRRGIDEHPTPACWPWPQVRAALLGKGPAGALSLRQRVALGLGAGMGLRSSEIFRLQVGDWTPAEGILAIGARQAKNPGSRRALPAPPTLARWLTAHAAGRPPDAPLILSESRRNPGPFKTDTWGQWCAEWLPAALGGQVLPAKAMRKTWATQAIASGLPEHHVEIWLGHAPERLAASTRRHYLVLARARELAPVSAAIESWLAAPVPALDIVPQAIS